MPIENKIYQNSIHFYGIHFEHNPQYIFSFQVVAVVLFLIPFYRRLKYHVEVQNATFHTDYSITSQLLYIHTIYKIDNK